MRGKLLPFAVGLIVGAIVAPKIRSWIPALPSVGR